MAITKTQKEQVTAFLRNMPENRRKYITVNGRKIKIRGYYTSKQIGEILGIAPWKIRAVKRHLR